MGPVQMVTVILLHETLAAQEARETVQELKEPRQVGLAVDGKEQAA